MRMCDLLIFFFSDWKAFQFRMEQLRLNDSWIMCGELFLEYNIIDSIGSINMSYNVKTDN